MTTSDISARIDRKEQALRAVVAASETVIAAKADLEFIKNRYTLDGLEGNNEKQRNADLLAIIGSEREGVALAEKNLRETQLELNIATLRVQEATMLLKVAESSSE